MHPSERAQETKRSPTSWFDRSAARKLALFSVLTGLTTSIVLLVVTLPGPATAPTPSAASVESPRRQPPVSIDPTVAPIAAAVTESGILISVIDGVEIGQKVHVATPEATEFDAVVVDVEPSLGVSLLKIVDDTGGSGRVIVTPVSNDDITPGSPVWVATAAFGVELSHISSSTSGSDGSHIPLEPFSASHHGGSVFSNSGNLIGWCVERDGSHWLVPTNAARSAVLRLDPDVVQP